MRTVKVSLCCWKKKIILALTTGPYIRQINRVNSRSDFVTMTAPWHKHRSGIIIIIIIIITRGRMLFFCGRSQKTTIGTIYRCNRRWIMTRLLAIVTSVPATHVVDWCCRHDHRGRSIVDIYTYRRLHLDVLSSSPLSRLYSLLRRVNLN